MFKVKIGDLIKGEGTDWLQPTIREQQLADMRQVNPQMPTRTRGGGVRKPGISEKELNDFQQQPAGEVLKPRDLYSGSDAANKRAEVLGARRVGGNLAEQTPMRTPVDRARRVGVDESKVTDPRRVKEFADMIQKDGGGKVGGVANATDGTGAVAPVSGYDDILKMMRHDALAEGDMARRQHNREVMTGLGDLVSSIANLWSTTKGGPNGYDNSKGMTATVQARYANDLARRRAQQEQILNYYRVKKAAEDDAETREYRRKSLALREKEEERRLKQAEAEAKRKDAITQSRIERDNAAKEAAENKTLESMGKSRLATRYNYYLEVEGREPEEARKLAIADADAWLAEQQKIKDEKEQSQTKKNNRSSTGKGGKSGGRGSSNKEYIDKVTFDYDDDGNKVGYTKHHQPAGAGYTKPKNQNTNRGYTKPGKK